MRYVYTILLVLLALIPIRVLGQYYDRPLQINPTLHPYQMQSVAPMSGSNQTEDEDDGLGNGYNRSRFVMRWSTELMSTNTLEANELSFYDVSPADDSGSGGLTGPGVPWVDDSETLPLDMGWDVVLLMLLLALTYSFGVVKKAKI